LGKESLEVKKEDHGRAKGTKNARREKGTKKQTIGDKVNCQKGNSPNHKLRS